MIFRALTLVLLAAGALSAQSLQPTILEPAPPIPGQNQVQPDDRTGGRLTIARQLMAQGAYISAVGMLESLYLEFPHDRLVTDLLLTCYIELKAYEKAELFLQRQLEQMPDDYRSHYLLLEIYLKIGNDSLLNLQADRIVEKFSSNRDIFNSIIRMLINYGRNEKARELIENARRQFGNDKLFAIEMASLLETRGEYFDAVKEYFRGAQGDTLLRPEIERRVAMLIRFQGAPAEVIRALKAILDSVPDDRFSLKMLEEAYVKSGQFADAFNISIRLDSLSGGTGQELFLYLRQCRERKLHEQTVKMAEYMEKRFPPSALVHRGAPEGGFSEYKFYYAEALAELGRFPEALEQYQFIIANYPQPRDRAEALLKTANIHRYNLLDYTKARQLYDSLLAQYQIFPYLATGRMELAKLAVVEGALDSAALLFHSLENYNLNIENREYIDYSLAMIQLYNKEYENADIAFRKLMADYPRGFYFNDAIINTLVISEAVMASPELLDLYSQAQYFDARLMPDSVEARYKAILAAGNSSMLGLTAYRLASFYIARERSEEALGVIGEIEKFYADNYFYPYCLKLKGDILFAQSERRGEAAELYRLILEKYSSYPFTGEVREKLQILEGYRVPG